MACAIEYREKILQLLLDRTYAGGRLPPVVEATRAAELDRLWNQMTPEEQEAFELWWDKAPDNAPEDLGIVDVVVNRGDTHLPRRTREEGND